MSSVHCCSRGCGRTHATASSPYPSNSRTISRGRTVSHDRKRQSTGAPSTTSPSTTSRPVQPIPSSARSATRRQPSSTVWPTSVTPSATWWRSWPPDAASTSVAAVDRPAQQRRTHLTDGGWRSGVRGRVGQCRQRSRSVVSVPGIRLRRTDLPAGLGGPPGAQHGLLTGHRERRGVHRVERRPAACLRRIGLWPAEVPSIVDGKHRYLG